MKYFEFNKPLNETYPEEANKLWDYLKECGKVNFNRGSLEDLYRTFSDEKYSAGWMMVNDQMTEEFANWLSEKTI